MSMTEKEQSFRHKMISQESSRENYKYAISLAVFLVTIGLIIFSILNGAMTVASILASTTLLGVLSLFLRNSKKDAQ